MPAEETEDDGARGTSRTSPIDQPWLFVIAEGDRPLAGGARYALHDVERVVLGRGDARGAVRDGKTLRVSLPGRTLSNVHARLVPTHGAMVVEDARSRNGTFIDGVRIERAALATGSVLEIGRITLQVGSAPALVGDGDLDSLVDAPPLPRLSTLRPELVERFRVLARIAKTSLSVLILGETGTGKEIVASSVHAASGRTGRFVAVNCGAMPAGLAEAQLFGHVKGAFSGALRDELGFVRAAHGGTLFLDEVAELPQTAQAALLRVIDAREVVPIGSTRAVSVDLRVVAATNRSLDEAVARGTFRDDLRARLQGFEVTVPPLRARKEDLGILVTALLRDRTKPPSLDPAVMRAFLAYEWPHNVRELGQVLASASALADDSVISLARLPERFRAPSGTATAVALGAGDVDDDRLRAALVGHLQTHQGNVAAVARAMGKAPMQIHRWMKRFGVQPGEFRRG